MSDNSDPLAQFRQTYFDECRELLEELETTITQVDPESPDSEELNAIFRAVHSMKAGAGAFKFTRLVEFSHIFETYLDQVRHGTVTLTRQILDVLIRASDILADLVAAAEDGVEYEGNDDREMIQQLESMVEGGPAETAAAEAPKESKCGGRYEISFEPLSELFRHANEPLLIIRELKTLGELTVKIDTSRLPALNRIEPEDSYFSWHFDLVTDRPEEDIHEAFEFVVDDCKLEIKRIEDDEDDEAVVEVQEAVSDAPSLAPMANKSAEASVNQRSSRVTSIRVELDRVDRLVNMVGEMVIAQAMVVQNVANALGTKGAMQLQGLEDLAMRTRQLQEGVMAIRMQPVKSVFSRMPRIVRDLAAKLGKKIELVTAGETTEVDKTVIEELGDPLTHMIRNSLDHGIETPEERLAAGKPETGTIRLSAEHRSGRIMIHITDDGRGIDKEKVLNKAIKSGLVTEDENLTDEEIYALLFHAGLSTADQVSEVSGRGVGMDVVRKNIQGLGGRISVESEVGKGTTFTLSLPLTLAVLDGMMVKVGGQKYIVPLTSIIETIRPKRKELRSMADGAELLSVRGEIIRLCYLSELFGIADAIQEPTEALVILVETVSGRKIGIVVDELLGQQQVVIKSLEDNFRSISGVSGATILGDGMVALIVDVDEMEGVSDRATQEELNLSGVSAGSDVA